MFFINCMSVEQRLAVDSFSIKYTKAMFLTGCLEIFTLESVLNKHSIVKRPFCEMHSWKIFELDENPFGFFTGFQYFKTFHRVQDLKDFCNCKFLVKLVYLSYLILDGTVGFTSLCCCNKFPDGDVELLIKFLRGLFDDFSLLNLCLYCFCVSAFILC